MHQAVALHKYNRYVSQSTWKDIKHVHFSSGKVLVYTNIKKIEEK
jgi:hypothetical protein